MQSKSLILSLLSTSILLAGCNESTKSANSNVTESASVANTTAAVETSNVKSENYKVVSQPSYPPFALLDEKGKVTGMDIDILNAIGEKQNISFTFLPHDMKGLLETVNTGQADIVATGVNITPERQAQYDFSTPYLEASWVAVLDKSKNPNIKSFEELREKPIATQGASLSETQLQATGITKQIVPVKTVYLGLASVSQGKATAVYDVDAVLNTSLKDNKNLYSVVDEKSGKVPFGFVFKKGNTQLKAKIDAGLVAIKKDGTFDKIQQKWYGANLNSTSDTVTASATK